MPWGMFGENFTTQGSLEDTTVRIGDRFRVGSAEFVVTQPRMPCFKLGIRFGRVDIIKRFLHSGRAGFYFAVTQEGKVAAGDSIELLARDEQACAARPSYPRFLKAGERIFASVSGTPMNTRNDLATYSNNNETIPYSILSFGGSGNVRHEHHARIQRERCTSRLRIAPVSRSRGQNGCSENALR